MPSPVGYGPTGYLFKISDSTGANFTTIALADAITGPNIAVADINVTTQDIPDGFQAFDPDIPDGGSFATTVIYRVENATHAAVLAAISARSILNVQLYNNPPTNTRYWSATGYFKKWDEKHPVKGDVMKADIEFKITGKPIQN
jgi:hypothetical protein